MISVEINQIKTKSDVQKNWLHLLVSLARSFIIILANSVFVEYWIYFTFAHSMHKHIQPEHHVLRKNRTPRAKKKNTKPTEPMKKAW